MLFAELLERLEQRQDFLADGAQFVTEEEFDIDQNLVVAGASRMNLLADFAKTSRQDEFDL